MLSIVAFALKTPTVIAMSTSGLTPTSGEMHTTPGPEWLPQRFCEFWFVQQNQKLSEVAILNGVLDPKAQAGSEHIVLHSSLEDALRHSEMLISMLYTPMHSSGVFLIKCEWMQFDYRLYDRTVRQLEQLPRQQSGSFEWYGRIPELSSYCSWLVFPAEKVQEPAPQC
jgi:hypothetical protein